MVGAPSLTETAARGDEADVKSGPERAAKHSGKLLVRMPATLHDELAHAAETEGVSLNQWITGALAAAVGWRGSGERPVPGATDDDAPAEATSGLRVALIANLVVLLIVAIAAIALLVIAALQL